MIYTNGLYLALSSSALFTSIDGTNWLQRSASQPPGNVFRDAVFGNGRVVIVGYDSGMPSTFASDPLVSLGINAGSPPLLNLSGVNGLSYGVQFSDSLNPANWQTLTNFTLSNSPSIWTDSTATNSQRYYRALWP